MGACNTDKIVIGRYKTVGDAFRAAVEECLYESGHDSYNGTLSTCQLVGELQGAPRYGTKAFDTFINKRLNTMEKWCAYYVEISGKELKRLKERHGFRNGAKNVKAYYFIGMAAC